MWTVRFLGFLLLLTLPLLASSQETTMPKIDSLLNELQSPDNPDHHLTIISDCVKYSVFTNVDTAEYFSRLYVQVATDYNDSLEMARGENFLGMVAFSKGHNEVAIEHYLNAIPAFEKDGDLQMVGILRNNVAAAYGYRRKHQETIEQYQEALKVFETLQDTFWIASVSHNMANEYHHLEEMDLVQEYQLKSMSFFRHLGDSTHVGYCYLGLGNMECDLENWDVALAHFNRAAELIDPEYDLISFANIDGGRCKICLQTERFNLADFYCKSALEISHQAGGFYNLKNAYRNIANLEKKRGNYERALAFKDTMNLYEDSLSNIEKDADIVEMVAKFESDQKQNKLDIQNLKLEASERRNNQFLAGIILLGLLVGIGVTLVVQTIRNNRKLAEKNVIINSTLQEKEVLLKEIHHRVKNNLQVITSLLSLQSREIEDPVALDAVKASQNRVRSMAMIHQNLYKEDSLNSVNAAGYLKNICDSVLRSYKVGEKDIQMSVECDEIELDIDTTIPLGLILNELITNALKYAFVEQESGIISVSLKSHDDDLILKVKDNGIGIEEDNYRKGTSIGLKLIEAFAKKLKATWKVIKNNGTEITFRFNQTS